MAEALLFDIALIIIAATILGYAARLLRQPVVLAYIVAGIIIGPTGLVLVSDKGNIATLSTLGIALMLFLVGLELDLRRLREVGRATTIAAFIQVSVTAASGYAIAFLLGLSKLEALYLSIAVAFSSTLIVVKLLSDKRELETLHGRIIIGILLIQDIFALFALALLSGDAGTSHVIASLIKILLMLAAAGISSFLLPYVFGAIARSLELLFLAALSWCFLFVGLAFYLDFSVAIGAFLAGISLASLPYTIEMSGRIKPLRDFFATMFFVSLGMQLSFASFSSLLLPITLICLVVLLIKPLSTLIPLSFMGHAPKTGFLSALSIAQLSEFSLILVAQGFILGHVSQQVVSFVTIAAALTILITTYLVQYDTNLYYRFSGSLKIFERLSGNKLESSSPKKRYEVILCGHNRIGYSIIKKLVELKKSVLVIDFNPEMVNKLKSDNIDAVYGDIGDPEFLEKIQLKHVSLAISTVPDFTDNMLLINKLKQTNRRAIVFVTAGQIEDALKLYKAGADYVVLPHFLGGERVSHMVEHLQRGAVLRNKLEHIKELMLRRELGHEHPSV